MVDGLIRDATRIIEKKFPVFARRISVYDSLGRIEVIAYGVPVQCAGVLVNPCDIVFADYDGVVIIPQAIAEEVIATAEDKSPREKIADEELCKGRKIVGVFAEHGVP